MSKAIGWVIAATVVGLVVPAGAVTSLVWVSGHTQQLVDATRVDAFTPSDAITDHIDRDGMSAEGTRLYLASRPEVLASTDFDTQCGASDPGFGILGCYRPSTQRIYLFDVTDKRLDGTEEVVAAHEMLHAAWDRMSAGERDSLAPLLEAEAASREDDKDFAERMAVYERVEPGERLNELHSIVGTELEEISPALEKHYAEFFSDRATVVALHVTSNGVFVELEEKTAALIAEMDVLREGVEADYKKYNSGFDKLNNDVDAFNAKANRPGGFATQYQFDQERAALMARQDSLESLYASIDKRADLYDVKLEELKQLNAQAAELNVGINVTPRDDTIG